MFVFVSAAAFAESMQFLTVLSQPVGSFAKMELLNGGNIDIFHLNFCNTSVDSGQINVSYAVSIANLRVEGTGNKLTSMTPQYNTGGLKVGDGGTATMGELAEAGSFSFSSSTTGYNAYLQVVDTLDTFSSSNHAQAFTTQVASFNTMKIPGVAVLGSAASGDTLRGDDFSWKEVGNNKRVLVSEVTEAPVLPDCPNGYRDDGTCKQWVAPTYGFQKAGTVSIDVGDTCETGSYSSKRVTLDGLNATACKNMTVKVKTQPIPTGSPSWGDCSFSSKNSLQRCMGGGQCSESTYQTYCIDLSSIVDANASSETCTYQTYVCSIKTEGYYK